MSVAGPWRTAVRVARVVGPEELAAHQQRRYARWTLILSWVNVCLALAAIGVVYGVSEQWWVTAALIYAPQSPLLLPSLLLFVCGLVWSRKAAAINLLTGLVILVWLCGFHFSMRPFNATPGTAGDITVLTCNVQNFRPNFGEVLREVARIDPDIVMFQEARRIPQVLYESLPEWNWRHSGQLLIGSRWSLSDEVVCEATPWERSSALAVHVRTPEGPVELVTVHLQTARRGLAELNVSSLLDGTGPAAVENHVFLRDEEARQTREFIDRVSAGRPLLVAGDLNMPEVSSVYSRHFGDLQDAFVSAGVGFGYTAPCRPVKFWLPRVPWLRIDHILTSGEWDTLECITGEFNGSDHRLVAARVRLRSPLAPPP